MKYILITGISSGIGQSIAMELLDKGYYVVGTVRKESDAKKFYDKYPNQFQGLILDLKNKNNIEEVYKRLVKILNGNNLHALINNSGVAIGGPLMHQNMDEIRDQFEINFFGLLDLTKKVLPLLRAVSHDQNQSPGKIINIGSTNGKIVYPFMGAYCATKHALEAISDALRYELKIYGIDVVLIEPGSVNTPIWDKADKTDLSPYANTDYKIILEKFKQEMIKIGKKGLNPEKVAKVAATVVENKNPKSRYIVSGNYFTEWLLPRILPSSVFDYLITRETGLNRNNF